MLRKKLALLLVGAMLVTTGIPAVYADGTDLSDQPAATASEGSEEAKIPTLFSIGERAAGPVIDRTKQSVMYKHLTKLSEEARIAGTQSEYDARDYIISVFEGMGYAPASTEFHWQKTNSKEEVVKEGNSYNIEAVKEGRTSKQVIVGAHYDSVSASTGTSDNASGVSVMLAAAEALKDVDTEYTIKFVAFGAEEVGVKGSSYYASKMTEEEINNTVAMINLDTVLFGDKMYAYGNLGRQGWLCEQALELAEDLDLEVVTQQGLNENYAKGTTGDWSDHRPFKELGITWLYFESTNWDILEDDGNFSDGYIETEKFGEIMHTGNDNMEFMDENYPGRMEDRLYTYTTLLTKLLVEIDPARETDALVVSTDQLSLSKAKTVTVTVDFAEEVDPSNIEFTFGRKGEEKALDEWKQTVSDTGRDGRSNPVPTETSFITVKEAPALADGKITAKIEFGLPYGSENLSLRPFPRRYYPDMIGEYVLKATDSVSGKSVSVKMNYNAFDSFHTQPQVKPAVQEIINAARDDRYIKYAPLGKSAEGRDIPFVILARDKASVDTYLNETLPMMLEHPTEMLADIEANGVDGYKPAIWFNNIHSDEANGVDAQIDLLRKLAYANEITFKTTATEKGGGDYGNYEKGEPTEVTLDVQELLDNYIILFSLNNNPDGRFNNDRATAAGFDPNRDVTYQTQVETATVFQALAKWSPMIFNDFHGFVSDFLIEPCTPPHEPNFEYDLIMDGGYDHAKAMGSAGIANSRYDHYIIPYDDYGDGWDDGGPMYAAVLSLLHGAIGHTIEIPELNQEASDAFMYAGLGSLKYALDNKEHLFTNQLKIYERGVNGIDAAEEVDPWFVNAAGEQIGRPRGENENFFPDYYVIPVDGKLQKNSLAAYEMAEFLINNGVKVEKLKSDVKAGDTVYPAGSFIVPMKQAKRGFANTVLYDGCDFSDFSAMYAEVTMCFPQLRGFDRYEVRQSDAFAGKTEALKKVSIPATMLSTKSNMVVIKNTNNDATKAVNELLNNGKKVYMAYEDGSNFDKGDFIVMASDVVSIKNKYYLEAEGLSGKASVKELEKPVVCGLGDEVNFVLKNLGFNLTDDYTKADVIVDEEGGATSDMMNAVEEGTDFIAIGGYGMWVLQSNGSLNGFAMGGFEDYYEGLLIADMYTDSVVTSRYNEKDYLYNNTDSWIETVPETSTVLATISNEDDFYVAGWWPNHEEVKGKAFIIQDEIGKGDVTVFANHIVNKAHNSHQFRLLSNAIYDGQEGDIEEITATVSSGGNKHHNSNSSTSGKPADKPQTSDKPQTEEQTKPEEQPQTEEQAKPAKAEFGDVKGNSWYAGAVNYVVSNGIMKGVDGNNFAPNTKTNRAMLVTMLYRLAGEPSVQKADFSDVKAGQYYENPVAWAQQNGIVTGFEGNKFMPGADLTREQLACFLYRFAQYNKADISKTSSLDSFADNENVSSYAAEAMKWAVGNGIINGKDGKLAAKDSATRAEVAAMLQRSAEILQ
ncbi:MAG: M20/M25/M40 family metallo-hydrolase [Anaerovoracaceae bacterium]